MQILTDSETLTARAAAKAIGLHVAPWLDAAAVRAAVEHTQKHRVLLALRNKWEADGKPADAEPAVAAAFSAYMATRGASAIESARCMSL